MRVAVVGDNCIDLYKEAGRFYPTGNIVDTGINLSKLGVSVSIFSTTGNDIFGKIIEETLKQEQIDTSHLKIKNGTTAITHMSLNETERVHGEYEEGVLADMDFDLADIEFMCCHDIVHTAFWGKAEGILPALKERNLKISFDYADRLEDSIVQRTQGYVDYGFFSYGKGRDTSIEAFLKERIAMGMKIAVATFGDKGSLAYDGEKFFQCKAVEAKVVNTVGAGDSFIAGFLFSLLKGESIGCSLKMGAEIASKVVSVFKPWIEGDYSDVISKKSLCRIDYSDQGGGL